MKNGVVIETANLKILLNLAIDSLEASERRVGYPEPSALLLGAREAVRVIDAKGDVYISDGPVDLSEDPPEGEY